MSSSRPRRSALDCGSCRLCVDACPTGALDEPGVARRDALPLLLDAAPAARRRSATAPQLGAQVYGCDICQDVCPWNRGVEKRRAGLPAAGRRRAARLARSTGCAPTRPSCAAATAGSTCRGTTARWLRRNALVAAGNVGGEEERDALEPYRAGDDELLREHAAWAAARLEAAPEL